MRTFSGSALPCPAAVHVRARVALSMAVSPTDRVQGLEFSFGQGAPEQSGKRLVRLFADVLVLRARGAQFCGWCMVAHRCAYVRPHTSAPAPAVGAGNGRVRQRADPGPERFSFAQHGGAIPGRAHMVHAKLSSAPCRHHDGGPCPP